MAIARRGFMPVKSLGGKKTVLLQLEVEATANTAYFVNDPVALKAGTGKVVAPIGASTSADMAGVIVGLFAKVNNVDPPRPLTFNQPTGGCYLTTGQSGYALVNVDAEQLYMVQIDTSASVGLIGKTASASAGTGNTRTGISGYCLKGSTVGTAADRPFKIVGLGSNELLTGYATDKGTNAAVLVKMNTNIFSPGTAGL